MKPLKGSATVNCITERRGKMADSKVAVKITYIFKDGTKEVRESDVTLKDLAAWLDGHQFSQAKFSCKVEAD